MVAVLMAFLTAFPPVFTLALNISAFLSVVIASLISRASALTSRFLGLVDFRPTPRSGPGGSSEMREALEVGVEEILEEIEIEIEIVDNVLEGLILGGD